MWTPTHVQVTVQRAKGLLYKGKNGTNDCFVTISLGKEKYQTSVKERATDPVEWHEECELPIPKQGNKAEIVLTALHRNFIGDEFLGQAIIPLSEFDVYEKPKNRWYTLKSKPGKEKKKERGDLEVKVGFTVRAGANTGSLSDLSKKDGLRSSLTSLRTSVGGSLLSLRGKEKKGSLKNLAKAVGSKVSTLPGRGKKKPKEDPFGTIPEHGNSSFNSRSQGHGEADPGVVSDDEDEFRFDELSHKSSHSSLSVSQVALSTPTKDGSLENLGGGEFLRRNYNTPPRGKTNISTSPENNRSSWNTGPVDEWDAKLFGKQQIQQQQQQQNNNNLENNNALNFSPAINRKEIEQPEQPVAVETKTEEIAKPEANGDGIKALLFATSAIFLQEKEPVPKPRQIHEVKEETKKSVLSEENSIIKEAPEEKKPKEKPKEKEHKEKSKNGAKETFASIFTPNKSKHEQEENQIQNSKGTAVGITNPILRQNDEPKRIPKEALRKYENFKREDLIELVMNLQTTVDCQKQKINDMESYIDDLLVRVLENQPTLLQSPLSTTLIRPLKSKKWSF